MSFGFVGHQFWLRTKARSLRGVDQIYVAIPIILSQGLSFPREVDVLKTRITQTNTNMKIIALIALVGSASAFAPATAPKTGTALFDAATRYGKYDDKMWDNDAKKDVYGAWDPATPRTGLNFNPFETWDGNSPDASGKYPGEAFYKDPQRGDISFQIMMDQKKEAEEREANPKAGDAPGCAGCRN